MKVDQFTMDSFADDRAGSAILRTAHENDAWHIIQRLAPANSSESKDGSYLLMLLDWPSGQIVRMIFSAEEMNNLSTALNNLNGLGVLDAFETEGATIQ